MPFVVALGPPIEIGVARLIVRALETLLLAPLIMAGAMGAVAVSRCGRVGWSRMPDLVNLDLSRLDMHGDLFDLRSPWESGQLIENNGEVGAWRLLH